MTVTTVFDTGLLTPLGAYLHLRAEGRASFLLESVEQGRLGRYSLVGCGSRLLSYEEAETAAEPVVGYLAYDFVSKLEPTVPMPDAGRGLPESRLVVADVLVRFDHVRTFNSSARALARIACRHPVCPPTASRRMTEPRRRSWV